MCNHARPHRGSWVLGSESRGHPCLTDKWRKGWYRPGCLGRGPWVPSCRERGRPHPGQRTTADEAAVSRDSSLLPFPGAAPTAPLSPGCQLSPLQARLEGRGREAACVAAWHTLDPLL